MMKSNTLLINKMSPEWMNHKESKELTLDILKTIYSDQFTLSPAVKRNSVCYWINDEQKANQMLENHLDYFDHDKDITLLVSCEHSLHLMNKKNIEVINLRKDSLDILVLGYFNYYLQNKSFPEAVSHGNETCLDAYRELLDAYTLSLVIEKTGLCVEKVVEVYKKISEQKPHHHLLMNDDRSERNVQTVRSICLLPLFQEELAEKNIEIPITFDSICGHFHFVVEVRRQSEEISPSSISIVEKICSKEMRLECKKTLINLYDLVFADKFDVDPFPVATL